MNKSFLFNITLLVVINLLIKPLFIFGIDLEVQRRVGETYGLYFALLNLTYIFQITADLGIQNYTNRSISKDTKWLNRFFPKVFSLKILLSVAYVLIALTSGIYLLGYSPRHAPLLLFILLNQVLVQFILFFRAGISGLGYFKTDSLLSALDKLLMLIICGALLYASLPGTSFSITSFVLAQTGALLLTALIAFGLLQQLTDVRLMPRWPGLRLGKQLLKQSSPFALVILLMFAYSRLDGILLERLLPDGSRHAEVFAGAYRLLDASNMFGYLFATLLLPMFSRILTQNTPEILQSLVQMSFKLIWAGSVTLCTAVFFLRNDLTAIMLPHDASAYRSDTLGTLIWVFIPVCSTYIFSTLLTAAGKLNAMNRVFVVGILLDLALNFLLIPDYKAIGAAIATLVTHLFVALWVAKHAIRLYGWQGNNSDLLVLTGFLAYSLVVSLLITSIPCTTACKLTFLSAAALTGVFMFRLLPIKETLRLLQVARD